jgi:hypothetical protein
MFNVSILTSHQFSQFVFMLQPEAAHAQLSALKIPGATHAQLSALTLPGAAHAQLSALTLPGAAHAQLSALTLPGAAHAQLSALTLPVEEKLNPKMAPVSSSNLNFCCLCGCGVIVLHLFCASFVTSHCILELTH